MSEAKKITITEDHLSKFPEGFPSSFKVGEEVLDADYKAALKTAKQSAKDAAKGDKVFYVVNGHGAKQEEFDTLEEAEAFAKEHQFKVVDSLDNPLPPEDAHNVSHVDVEVQNMEIDAAAQAGKE